MPLSVVPLSFPPLLQPTDANRKVTIGFTKLLASLEWLATCKESTSNCLNTFWFFSLILTAWFFKTGRKLKSAMQHLQQADASCTCYRPYRVDGDFIFPAIWIDSKRFWNWPESQMQIFRPGTSVDWKSSLLGNEKCTIYITCLQSWKSCSLALLCQAHVTSWPSRHISKECPNITEEILWVNIIELMSSSWPPNQSFCW